MSSEHSFTHGVGNRRGWQKTRVVSPVMSQVGCPGREPDCLKPAGTWVGVSACMYNDSNLLETGPRRIAEAKAGTREQGRELALAYMWQIHMKTESTMDAKLIAGTAQTHCRRGLTPACQWGPALSSHMSKVVARVCLSVQE